MELDLLFVSVQPGVQQGVILYVDETGTPCGRLFHSKNAAFRLLERVACEDQTHHRMFVKRILASQLPKTSRRDDIVLDAANTMEVRRLLEAFRDATNDASWETTKSALRNPRASIVHYGLLDGTVMRSALAYTTGEQRHCFFVATAEELLRVTHDFPEILAMEHEKGDLARLGESLCGSPHETIQFLQGMREQLSEGIDWVAAQHEQKVRQEPVIYS